MGTERRDAAAFNRRVGFGDKVRALLGQAGITQKEFAEMLGCKRSTVCKWINGSCMPEVHNLMDVANALSVDPNSLLFDAMSDELRESAGLPSLDAEMARLIEGMNAEGRARIARVALDMSLSGRYSKRAPDTRLQNVR